MESVPLTQGYFALLDDADYERLKHFRWIVDKRTDRLMYAARSVNFYDGHRTTVRMHQDILGTTGTGQEVDHRDGNGLNNQRSNLRLSSRSGNCHNMRPREGKRVKGVTYQSRLKKFPWQARIAFNGRQIHLGYFSTAAKAAFAYNVAAAKLCGEFARLNVIHRKRTTK